ncbi:unnamed protein product [Angiostrongylus costaricensis]|uniref:AKAP2_C domain-containing protein n=1 Tax=Angiostrongylus costaricensis TaxID=334426 RepID=A0A0R3PVA4_ANGCS|nr:unnamed protein product [Angiostrongylus costaricensis]
MQKDQLDLMKETDQNCDLDSKDFDNNKECDFDKCRLRKNSSSCEDTKEFESLKLYDSHIPDHLRPKGLATNSSDYEGDNSDQEESKHKERFTGFGLVGAKKKDELPNTTENPYELSRRPVPPVYKKPESRGPLTEEERQKRLKEMAKNAEWRQEIRKSNIKVASMKEDEEAAEDLSGKAPSFLRSQINTAAADLTVEQRLQRFQGDSMRLSFNDVHKEGGNLQSKAETTRESPKTLVDDECEKMNQTQEVPGLAQ